MVEILVMNIHAIKIRDWDMFLASMRLIVPWIQVYGNNKYGKWLVEFWLEISNLPDSKAEYFKDGLFAQSITGKPYTCLPLDLWIEMTMNKASKMKAGWKQIRKNETILLCHTRNANSVNMIRLPLHEVKKVKLFNSQIHQCISSSGLGTLHCRIRLQSF